MKKPFFAHLSTIISTGFAIFAMLFGAGNVIYPLALGRDIGHHIWFGLAGFAITAIIIPLVGLVAVMLCDGSYEKFLSKIGRIPGFVTITICMMLLGPLVFSPRCITISHASVGAYFPNCSLFMYSLFSAAIIFFCTIRKSGVMTLLGYVLGPIKFTLLFVTIIAGFIAPHNLIPSTLSSMGALHKGFTSGYWTGDLLATIFFSGLIYAGLKKGLSDPTNYRQLAFMGLQAGSIGAILLLLVYGGFCCVAAFNASSLQGIADADIFSNLVPLLLGPIGGVLANITVALATITTAIALTSVVANFFQQSVFRNRINYWQALLLTIAATTLMSNLGFAGIMQFAGPIIFAIYPALIVLAITSSLLVLFGFKWIKVPVLVTFMATLVGNNWHSISSLITAKSVEQEVIEK